MQSGMVTPDEVGEVAGVEWWSQMVAPNKGLHIHIDQDSQETLASTSRHRETRGTLHTPFRSMV